MAAGLMFGTKDTSSKAELYQRIQDLAARVRQHNGSIICKELLAGIESSTSPTPSERNELYYKKRPCVELVGDAVEIFEEYIKENYPATSGK